MVKVIDRILDAALGLVGMDSPMWLAQLVWWVTLSITVFSVVMTSGALFTFVFRRLFAFFTQRIGPNRVGPFGLFQLVADGIKMVTKEDIIPARADRPLFRAAPYIAIVPFVMAFAPIPWTGDVIFSNVGMGILFILAISAVSPVAEIAAGWASNNKYAIYGGVRAAALDFSYEIPMVLAVLGVVVLSGTLDTVGIVEAQRSCIQYDEVLGQCVQRSVWFFLPQILGVFIFFVAALAKAGLVPTDLPEAESELVAGYSTEYSGMRFGLFYVVLFANILFIGALVTTLFLGGWLSPFGTFYGDDMLGYEVFGYQMPSVLMPDFLAAILGDGIQWFLVKTVFFCFLIFWLWLTLPRVRVDQYLNLAWKVLFPLSLLNLVIAGYVRWYWIG
jgi:NADH-quinone oxidoreductase subunit H